MLVAFLIMLREGLEAALIVGIMASYTVRRGNAGALPSIWAGVLAAFAASAAGAFLLIRTGQEFPQRAQEIFEAAVGAFAVVLLLSMALWMRRAGRGLKHEIEHSLDSGLASGSGGWSWPLFFTAFLIVGREGLESAMFLVAITQQATGPGMFMGAMAGLGVAALVGLAIFRLGLKIHLGKFFRVTGVLRDLCRRRSGRLLLAPSARGGNLEHPARHGLRPERRAADRWHLRHAAVGPVRLYRHPDLVRGDHLSCGPDWRGLAVLPPASRDRESRAPPRANCLTQHEILTF